VIAGESPQHRPARFVTTGRGLVPESTAGAQNKTLISFKEVILLDTLMICYSKTWETKLKTHGFIWEV
jgi:hypothetical protein